VKLRALIKGPAARRAVFGGSDGMMSLLGVVGYLLVTHPKLIFPTALSGAISSGVSMAAGDFMSADTDTRLPGAAVMFGATVIGGAAPAVPWAFTSGAAALACAAGVCVVIAGLVAFLREAGPGQRWVIVGQTFAILAVVLIVTIACDLWIGSTA
jgi:hypothetical protein